MNSFFSSLYEKFYFTSPFCDDIYQYGLYGILGTIALIGALVMMTVFYYIINRPSFSRWYHWLIVLGIHFVLQFGICFLETKSKFTKSDLEYHEEYWTFGFMHAVFATILYIIFSFLFRWGSKNCKRTPIPN